MSLAITPEHRELEQVARRFLKTAKVQALSRSAVDGVPEPLDEFWAGMAEQGWMGLHLEETYGGQGFGPAELTIVLAQLGAVVAPGAFTSTVVAATAIARCGTEAQRRRWLPAITRGDTVIGLSVDPTADVRAADDGTVVLTGTDLPVIGAVFADLLAVRANDEVVLVPVDAPGLTITRVDGIDPTLGVSTVSLDSVRLGDFEVLRGAAAVLQTAARLCYAAEAVGIASATLDSALAYAKTRVQFGKPIGSFQAVKHHCANMAVRQELAVAAVWDAAGLGHDAATSALLSTSAAAAALQAAQHNCELNIQLHGGIGFTWEHDAHLFLRRAVALAQLLGPRPTLHDDVYAATAAGVRPSYVVDLPEEADDYRRDVRAFVERYTSVAGDQAREMLVDSGYLTPHWPKPFGRAAGPVEQLVVDAELEGIELPNLGIGSWVLLTLAQVADAEQVRRWVRPGLLGENTWCQLFSEPGAGSDASAISTRASKVDGGWLINGQKVWTSAAHACDRGLATVRTDPTESRHRGITTVVVDMKAPGVTIRPLREITGEAMFNEVFLDSVFVSDSDVVGGVGNGWQVARATLGNERVSIGGGAYRGITAQDLVDLLAATTFAEDVGMRRRVGELLVEAHVLRLLSLRQVARALAAGEAGYEGSISKLVSAEHAQRVSALGIEFSGAAAAVGGTPRLTFEYLFSRCLTIGGGTSEISRNVIAERILGLPR